MSEKQIITINSALIYVIAFLTTTIIHELAHAIIGLLCNSDPVIHHNYVRHLSSEQLSVNQKVAIALAGPVVSLIQGIVSGFVYSTRSRNPHGLSHLFLLWFSVLGLFNFLGYLMTGIFFKKGDIGKAYLITNTPLWLQITLAIIAALFMLLVAYKMTAPYLKFSYKDQWIDNGKAKKSFSFHVLFLPWMIGTTMVTLLYFPIVAIVSIIYPITSGFIFIFPWQNADSIKEVEPTGKPSNGSISIATIIIFCLIIFLFKFILTPGIKLPF